MILSNDTNMQRHLVSNLCKRRNIIWRHDMQRFTVKLTIFHIANAIQFLLKYHLFQEMTFQGFCVLRNLLKSATDKMVSSILYRLHFLQVWPSLNIAYELLRQIQTDVCIERISKYNWEEHLNDLTIYSLIWLRNSFLRWPYLQKMESG